jgi:hypothetical protein
MIPPDADDPELQKATGDDPELQKLQAQIAALTEQVGALTEQVRELQRKLEPAAQPTPFVAGPPTPGTEQIAMRNLRMSAEAVQRMVEATPDELLRQVREDRHATAPASVIPDRDVGTGVVDPNPNERNLTGWRNPAKLKSGLQQ